MAYRDAAYPCRPPLDLRAKCAGRIPGHYCDGEAELSSEKLQWL
jgi:hypothetical protein